MLAVETPTDDRCETRVKQVARRKAALIEWAACAKCALPPL